MTSQQLMPLGIAALGALFLILPNLALRSAGGDDLFPGGNQAHLKRMVRFAAVTVMIVGAILSLMTF